MENKTFSSGDVGFGVVDGNACKCKNVNDSIKCEAEWFKNNLNVIDRGDVKMSEESNPKSEAIEISKRLIVERQMSNNRMGINDDKTNTNLISKNYSPLIVRKLNIINGWPLYVGLICDWDLSDLDFVINGVVSECYNAGLIGNNIQGMRNFTGILSETLISYYNGKKENCVEGVAIFVYVDKTGVQNFFGDFMNHTSCRIEWSGIMNILPHI